jgi:hypothetical protein
MLLAGAWLAACGPSKQTFKPNPDEPAEQPQGAPDAYRDFGGEKVDPGAEVELLWNPVGIKGAEFVVRLEKVELSTWTDRDGVEQVDATAYLSVKKGQQERRVNVEGGESETVWGATIHVISAGLVYNDERMNEIPTAKIRVELAGAPVK